MTDGLRTERSALPLAEAAARLGLSAEALRRRVERAEARGFIRDGEYFVYVNDVTTERRFGGGAPEAAAAQPGEPPADSTLPVVVEFQKMELTRLLRENERLNSRLDQLMDEIRHLRDMQQREQVLRQQEQGLRRQIQDTLDQLAGRLALPPPRPAPAAELVPPPAPAGEATSRPVPADEAASRPAPASETYTRAAPVNRPAPAERRDSRPELVLTRTVPTKKTLGDAKTGPGTQSGGYQPGGYRPGGYRPGASAAYLATGRHGQWRREPHAVMPKTTPERPAAPTLSAAPASVENGGIAPEEAAELAGILQDIGNSLRDSEAFRRFPPITPALAPMRAGDRRAGDVPRPGMVPPPTGTRAAADPLPAEEKAILAILDSMGPTIEDRRAAAGRMRRLLRSRLTPSRQET